MSATGSRKPKSASRERSGDDFKAGTELKELMKRVDALMRLDSLASNSTEVPLAIIGSAGRGKSSLIRAWLEATRKELHLLPFVQKTSDDYWHLLDVLAHDTAAAGEQPTSEDAGQRAAEAVDRLISKLEVAQATVEAQLDELRRMRTRVSG